MPDFVGFFTFILLEIYKVTGNLGLSIIGLTLILRSILFPLTLPSLRSQKELRKLKPELDALKEKHTDKQELQQKQLELYKKYNINPLAGCLPQIFQLVVLILLYRTLITFLGDANGHGMVVDTTFLWWDLTIPDNKYILPVLAGGSQFLLSLMLSPASQIRDIVPNKSKSKEIQKENTKEENQAEMAQTMQQQMMFMMPLMTGFIATRFPSGLALYWVVSTLFSLVQQVIVSGPGGLTSHFQNLWTKFKNRDLIQDVSKESDKKVEQTQAKLAEALKSSTTTKPSKKTKAKTSKPKKKSKKKGGKPKKSKKKRK